MTQLLNKVILVAVVVALSGRMPGQNVVVNPTGNQNLVQPAGTSFNANTFNNIRYVTASDDWNQSPSGSLTGGTAATITLSPCPLGVYGSDTYSYVYLSTTGTAEAVQMSGGGSCTPGASSGTITFTPANSHAAGYTVGTAYSGIQEAINDACGITSGTKCAVIIPPGASGFSIYGTVYVRCSDCLLDGDGALVNTYTRDQAFMLGAPTGFWQGITLRGLSFSSHSSTVAETI